MPAETHTAELSRRLASLSPDRRALLERRLLRTAADASASGEIPVQPRGDNRDFPLSTAQERMWFNHHWNPERPVYNESFGVVVNGHLNAEFLAKSFDFVMTSHEIFGVTFHTVDGRFMQRLQGCDAPRMQVRDLRSIEPLLREEAYESDSRRLLREPFALSDGPLFRAGLWRMADNEHRLIFAMHHIIFDGWSGGMFFRELFTAYMALVDGRQLEFPPVRPQYVDFAVWESKHLEESGAVLGRQLDYWKQQLAGTLTPPQLPVDRQVSGTHAHDAGHETFVCTAESAEALKALAKDSGATPFMAFLAIFNLLLARYSGQTDIVVGLPTVNRTHSSLSDIIGVFINMAIFRTDLSGDVTFRELLGRVRKTALDAQANQEVPLERVVRALALTGDAARSLVSVLFDMQKKSQALVEPPGLAIRTMDVGTGVAKFDLVLAMEDTGVEFKGVLEYDAEKFDRDTVCGMVRHFTTLMRSAVAEPDIPASRLPIMDAVELAGLEVRGASTAQPTERWAYRDATLQARQRPDILALSDGTTRLSYREFHARAARLATLLTRRGVSSGSRVAIFLSGGIDLAIAQLAVMMTGAAFVPMDPADPIARTEFMIRDCEASLVIAKSSSPTPAIVPVLCIDRGEIDRCEPFDPPADRSGSDPAYLIYTSGSTGQPKGVVVSHAALANLIAWHHREFAITSADRATQLASVAFDASVWELWPYLAAGASMHFPPRELIANPAGLRDWLVRNNITVTFAPTPVAEELIALDWPAKGKLRFLLTGGDRLRKRPHTALPFEFVNNYGPTENAVVTTSGRVSSTPNEAAPSIGGPIDNVWLRIVDPNMQPLPQGVPGELIAGGRSLANGYWNRPSLTAEKFVVMPDGERGYRTGDLCRLLRDGDIEFLGRIDTQVKVRGCRIELSEIESALLAHPAIRDAVADVRDIAGSRRGIVAYIVPHSGAPTALELRAFLAERLPGYMTPSHFVPISAVPMTTNGKVDRKSLPSPNVDVRTTQSTVPPRTVSERTIASIWKDLLNVANPGVRDDFFQSGGDSLLATRLAVAIREKLGVEIPLVRIMSGSNIEALAQWADSAQQSSPLPACVIPLKAGRSELPPLFLAPPAAGSPACYLALASAFPGDRAIYGFEAPGLISGRPIKTIPQQARHYLEALTAIQPHGPYYIAGWSLGGPVAFEMACQLREAGEQVAYLSLLDAGLPENGRLPGGLSWLQPMWWALSFPFTEGLPINYATLCMLAKCVGIRLPESWSAVRRDGLSGALRAMGGLLAGGWRSSRVFLASLSSLQRYQPRPFDGTVTLFQTALRGALENSGDVLPNNIGQWSAGVAVHPAPGSHMTLLLDPKIASAFAPGFEATLNHNAGNAHER